MKSDIGLNVLSLGIPLPSYFLRVITSNIIIATKPGRLNFVLGPLIFVGPECEICIISLLAHEFWKMFVALMTTTKTVIIIIIIIIIIMS